MQREHLKDARYHPGFRRRALAVAIGGSLALAFGGVAYGQAVTGTIHGTVPVASNEAIQITGGAGYNRTVPVGPDGRYAVTLPVGTYTVSLLHNGAVVESQTGVTPVAAGGVTVNFTSSAQNAVNLNAVTVSASAVPPIDVTTTTQVETITAKQLQQLPLGRSAEAIALLAPGTQIQSVSVFGSPLGTPAIDFGGASTVENAYYIDGMNTTYQLINTGALELPYGAIEQQQTFISGYGAKYGRSIGGVINQIGKSGSNQWHFGVHVLWELPKWRSSIKNVYYANPLVTTPGRQPGDLIAYNRDAQFMRHTYDAYVSGPIIKDKLFFYVNVEKEKMQGISGVGASVPQVSHSVVHQPKTYVKLNWNINANNVLTVTALQSQNKNWGTTYDYDLGNHTRGKFLRLFRTSKVSLQMWVANFTSYITDNLTVHAMFGKQRSEFWYHTPPYPGLDPTVAHVFNADLQNPLYTPNGPIPGTNPISLALFNAHQGRVTNYRVSIDYRLGSHDFQIGIDNINVWDNNDGSLHSGPGYAWLYGHHDPGQPIVPGTKGVAPYVGPPNANAAGATGYYVAKQVVLNVASLLDTQRAQYIVDHWQVTPRLRLNLGLRNSQFTNNNAAGIPYIRLTKPQWAPRLGFSWDVHGDSSLKVFGNAGRYYLAIPSKTGLWMGTKQTFINYYGTYTGIDQNTGAPTGFQPLPQTPSTGVSPNNEYGTRVKDPRLVAAKNIQAEFSDNYVVGMKKAFTWAGTKWVFGATATYQDLSRLINNYGDLQRMCTAGRAQGLDFMTAVDCGNYTTSLLLINPNENAIVYVKGPDGKLHSFNFTAKDQGFPMGPKRKYYAIDLMLEHQWDGRWFMRADYVFSRLWGNSEGPVSSEHGQPGSYNSVTVNWDTPERMSNSNGFLPLYRKHTFKVHGAFAITPEWTVAGSLYVASGTPKICLGAFGPDQTFPFGSSTYFWCGGKPAPIGSHGFMPWVHTLDLNVNYAPAWADHKLAFNLAVFNVFNFQTPTERSQYFGSTASPTTGYNSVINRTGPRQMRFSISYNW